MIVKDSNYFFISENSNESTYWRNEIYPEWSSISTFRPCLPPKLGHFGFGVEPHYHDCDEIWLFTNGNGEVWLDDKMYKITPNTLVYTPMGTVHRFQMFTDFENTALVTRLERQKRPIHIIVEEHGLPEKTVPGFVVSGENNNGPIANRGMRCPLTELRQIIMPKNGKIEKEELASNEYWAVIKGDVSVKIEKFETLMSQGDVALLKCGIIRELRTENGCRLAIARE
jgi:mannose-6-phosphate isomerase-like protein (cupin superfamily)